MITLFLNCLCNSPRDDEDKRRLADAEGRVKSLGGEVAMLKNEVLPPPLFAFVGF